MQDVARRAGVSVMTVSNVVNEQPHVRAATRSKVLAAITELGYHVNTAARSLRQGRTGVIVLAVPEIDRPYFGLLATLLIERAAARGYDVLLEQTVELVAVGVVGGAVDRPADVGRIALRPPAVEH